MTLSNESDSNNNSPQNYETSPTPRPLGSATQNSNIELLNLSSPSQLQNSSNSRGLTTIKSTETNCYHVELLCQPVTSCEIYYSKLTIQLAIHPMIR